MFFNYEQKPRKVFFVRPPVTFRENLIYSAVIQGRWYNFF